MNFLENLNPLILSIWEINTKFHDRCYMDWSDENLLCIVSPDGIYILTPQLDVHHGPFAVDLLENPKSRFVHTALKSHIHSFDKLWQTMDNHQYMEVYLNPALTTNIDKLPTNLHRKFRLAKWSPVIETYPSQCLLTTITVDHQLSVFYRVNRVWIMCADLSDQYDKIWARLNEPELSDSRTFESIHSTLTSVSFCMLCWKITKDNQPLILAATITGDIVIWRLVVQQHALGRRKFNFIPEIVLRTYIDHINSMNMFDDLLIVSTRFGQVVLFDITTFLNQFASNPIHPEQGDQEEVDIARISVTCIPPTVTLWHRDNIEVMDFYVQPIEEETFRLVLAKSTNICWSMVHYKKGASDKQPTLAVSDSFSAIDGLDPEVSLHQTPANWLKKAGPTRAILTADDGSFFSLEFGEGHAETIPEFSAIRTGKVDLTDMVPRGLATSPRGNLVAMVSCVSFMYDTAKIASPSRLILVPTVNDRKFFTDCIHKVMDESWLRDNKIRSPMDVCDRIDYIRSVFPHLKHDQLYDLFRSLQTLVGDVVYPSDESQLVRLKILRFILVKLNEFNESGIAEVTELADKLFDIIFAKHIETILSSLLDDTRHQESDDILGQFSKDQVNSLRNYNIWLRKSTPGINILHKYSKQFEVIESKYNQIPKELCLICRSEVSLGTNDDGICSNLHRMARCARTLLILEGFLADELICQHCKRHYRPQLVWPTKSLWLCCICQ